jgi:hypothetical protein
MYNINIINKCLKYMGENFWEKVKRIDWKKSGNPTEKYKTGSIKKFAEKNVDIDGNYIPYIDSVIKEAEVASPELDKEIERSKNADFSFSREEHDNPGEYRRKKEASDADEETEEKRLKQIEGLENDINNLIK